MTQSDSQGWWDSSIQGIEQLIGLTGQVLAITDKPKTQIVTTDATRQTLQNQLQTPAQAPFNWKPWAIGAGLVLGFIGVLLTILKVLKD